MGRRSIKVRRFVDVFGTKGLLNFTLTPSNAISMPSDMLEAMKVKDLFSNLSSNLHHRKKVVLISASCVIVVALISGFWLLMRGPQNTDSDVRLKIIPEDVDVQIKDIHLTEVGDPDLTWELKADTARYVKKDSLAYFDRVRIKLIRADGKTVTLTGKEGILHTDTRDAEVKGSVIVVSNNGDIVETERLFYSHSERRIFTEPNQKIELRNPRMVITGTGMSLTLADQRVTLMSGVVGKIQTGDMKRFRR